MSKQYILVVSAKPSYVEEQSDPVHQKFVWSYEISIANQSEEDVQLLKRHWIITDMTGKVEEVQGVGVVGLQPLIKTGKVFSYTSFCKLNTPQGTMEGHYILQNLDEEQFKIEIPKFILSAPSDITQTYKAKLH